MLTVLSPSKTLDTEAGVCSGHTLPALLEDSAVLNRKLRSLSKKKLKELMGISDKLAVLNVERNKEWSLPFSPDNAATAAFTFQGDVYTGLDACHLSRKELDFAQGHLRILSGLYGLLRPLDLMQPYRLEMGTALKTRRGPNLYRFWDDRITRELNAAIAAQSRGERVLINLASGEYFKAIVADKLDAAIITPVFKEERAGKLKVISFVAKKSRGMMARYIIRNRIRKAADIKAFDDGGYAFRSELSTDTEWVFSRV